MRQQKGVWSGGGGEGGLRRVVRGAFTLIEVLVVVAIIALLAAILLPSLARARAQARSTVCVTHERQIGTAMNVFSIEHRGRVPRGLSRHPASGNLSKPPNWLRMIVRMFGDKRNYEENFNRVPVERHEVFSCPARSAEYGKKFLDYVVNSTDSRGPISLNPCRANPTSGVWYEVEGVTKIDRWERPSDVVYVMDAVEESWNVVDATRSLKRVREEIAQIRALVEPNINQTGLDWFDVPGGKTFPTFRSLVDAPGEEYVPRASLKMHLGLGSNAVYADGHVDMLKPPPDTAGALEAGRFYMKKMGVDRKLVPQISLGTFQSVDATLDRCAEGDTTWRP